MAEFLLEILSEEIPARMQEKARMALQDAFVQKLKAENLSYDHIQSFVTPRRLVVVVDGLPQQQSDVREERKGPRVGAPQQALDGFLNAVGLTIDQCEKQSDGKGEFYVAVIEKNGRPTQDVLSDMIADVIAEFHWPKSMRWGSASMRWVRPLQNVMALLDGKLIAGEIALGNRGILPFVNETSGHRFMAPEKMMIKNFDAYQKELRAGFVMVDQEERRATIEKQLHNMAKENDVTLCDDPALLDEVAGLVEWPVVLMGDIDKEFMKLPAEVLQTTMRSHQKYFSVLQGQKPAAHFLVVANMITDDKGAAIVRGNERVLRARLHDAKFFYDQDVKTGLDAMAPKLAHIVFYDKLGTMADKVVRLQGLSATLCQFVDQVDAKLVRRTAQLCKADLVSGMVGEFPELQGVMGSYYALAQKEDGQVAQAIADHYKPAGAQDDCPTDPIAVVVALADKLDNLMGFWSIHQKPTGSKDPFALRRAALGIIRILIENKLRVPLLDIFKSSPFQFDHQDLLAFFEDRLKVYLRDQGINHEVIAAIFAKGLDDLYLVYERAQALQKFIQGEDGSNLLAAYKRAANIVQIEVKKDKKDIAGQVEEKLLAEASEKSLFAQLAKTDQDFTKAIANDNFNAAVISLAQLRLPLDDFFEKVIVNSDDPKIRQNRLRLLVRIRDTMNQVADFSKIGG